jgi:hypothetical protein
MKNRILIVGNCQSAGYGFFLAAMCPDTEVEVFPLGTVAAEERERRVEEVIARKQDFDAVLSPPLSERFFSMAKDEIRASFLNIPVYIHTNVFFSGTTPDLTYVRGSAGNCVGPIGEYHSKIVLYGFMNGLDVKETRSLFNRSFMAELDLFNEYRRSQDRLIALDAESDIRITDMIFAAIKSDLLFFSNNHPTSRVFFEYARRMAARLAGDGWVGTVLDLPWNPLAYPNMLASSAVFPVYPDIAREHDLPYGGEYYFKAPDRPHFYSLSAFIEQEYAAFEAYGRTQIEEAPQWADINEALKT